MQWRSADEAVGAVNVRVFSGSYRLMIAPHAVEFQIGHQDNRYVPGFNSRYRSTVPSFVVVDYRLVAPHAGHVGDEVPKSVQCSLTGSVRSTRFVLMIEGPFSCASKSWRRRE